MGSLLSSILYIPLMEILFTVVVCDKDLYFDDNFTCWGKEHIPNLIISSLCIICLYITTDIYITFSFHQNEKYSKNIYKFLINNSKKTFNLIRTLSIFLLEISVIYKNNIIIILSLFVLSLINFVNNIQEIHYNKENDLKTILTLLINSIYFWNSLCLLIGYNIRNTSFNSLFEILLLGIILMFIYFLTYLKDDLITLKSFDYTKSDLEVLKIINLILNCLEKKNVNRENLLNIIGYISFKDKSLNLLTQDFSDYMDEKEFNYYVLQHLEKLYKTWLNYYRNSIILQISYALFQIEKQNRYNKSYLLFSKLIEENDKNLKLFQQYFIYRIKRNLEEKGIEENIDKTSLSYKYQSNKLINMIHDICENYLYFWSLLLSSEDFKDLEKLDKLGFKINKKISIIEEQFKKLQKTKYHNGKIIKLYGKFIKDILNNPFKAKKYLNEHIEKNENFIINKAIDLNSINSENKFQFIIISGKKENFGIILKISPEFSSVLGYPEFELIGQNMSIIIPDFLQKIHENVILEKISKLKVNEDYNKKLKNINAYLKCNSKRITYLSLDVGFTYDEDYNSLIIGKINYENDLKLYLFKNYFILINKNLIIENFSANCIDLFGKNNNEINDKIINKNADITSYIKNIQTDINLKLSKVNKKEKLNILKIKLNIFKKKYLTPGIITWKSGLNYKITIDELLFNTKNYGYIIKLSNLDDLFKNSSIIYNNRHSNKKNKKASNLKNKNYSIFDKKLTTTIFDTMNKNFIPEVITEVDFDIDEKKYIFEDKKIKYKKDGKKNKINNTNKRKLSKISSYFNQKFFPSNNNLMNIEESSSGFHSSSKSHSNLNDYESSSSFDTSEDEQNETEEEEEESQENSNNNNKNDLSHIIEQFKDTTTENNFIGYYKVNLQNISYYVYDFKKNIPTENKLVPKEDKMHEVYQEEKFKNFSRTKTFVKKGIRKITSSNNNLNYKKMMESNLYNKINNEKIDIEIINKIIKNKLINKSIKYFLLLYTIILIIIIVINIIYFKSIIHEKQDVFKINTLLIFHTNLFRTIEHSFFFTFEIILLKNEKYTNFYQNSREEYYNFSINYLKYIYNRSYIQLNKLISDSISISSDTKNKINNKKIEVYTFFMDYEEYNFNIISDYQKSIVALVEFSETLFKFIYEENSINAVNPEFLSLIFNVDNNIMGLEFLNEVYLIELKNKIKFIKIKFTIYFCTFIIISIFVIYLGLKANKFIYTEKEKYLKYFFEIKIEQILYLIHKTENFNKNNIEKTSNLISEPKINLHHSENFSYDEENNLLIEKSNSFNKVKKQNDLKKKINKNMFENLSDIKNNLIMIIIFYISLTILFLILGLLFYYKIREIYRYNIIFILILTIEKNILNCFNNIRTLLLFYTIAMKNKFLINLFQTKLHEINNIFTENTNIFRLIISNLTKYKFPAEMRNYVKIFGSKKACEILENSIAIQNFSCQNIGSNISNYGINEINSFIFSNFIYLITQIYKQNAYAISQNLTYVEILYNTPYYNYFIPSNEEDYKRYQSLNPFNIYNEEKFKDLTVIIIFLMRPIFSNLIDYFLNSTNNIFNNLNLIIKISSYIIWIIVSLFYILYLIPYIYIKNIELNRTKKMLEIIPKNIMIEIIKKERIKNR